MNWKSFLKSMATVAIGQHPVGAALLSIVNKYLPVTDALPATATGVDVESAIGGLTAGDRAKVYQQFAAVRIAESQNFTANVRAMAQVDMTGHSTRPLIALMMAWLVVVCALATVGGYVYAIVLADAVMAKSVADSWLFVGAVLATPTYLLRAYFGLRTTEKQSRYAASNGEFSMMQDQGLLSRWFGGKS
ncbi:hypothetical protein FKG94_03165 [Exilibacterium tricleocarpae]|uniref:Uncharacterized protein n=1 Tax=Exilibacterium tricleocarpae TaxID=2591008 RepID=A0A545U6Y2_9GAMM|nr:hypothetical protein [Exilibacterium tricleocarpae]TQV85204.1 hypothetical protein FKG94_03165 [Exilibacterium tricleocarpae]